MKKTLLISIAALALFCNVEARSWNFSKWSSKTQENLVSDELWTEDEKGSGTKYEGCFWFKATSVEEATDSEGNLKANGVAISEMEGLKITAYGSGGAAIGVNYKTTTDGNNWGPYHGEQYLWFAGTFHIQIPQIAAGTTIKVGIESHKPGDKRGLDMYVGGQKVTWTSGQEGYPDSYDEYTWVVPGDDGESVDVEFYQSKGCHVYMIETDEKDGGMDAEEIRVAYIYDGTYNGAKDADKNPCGWLANGGLDNDPIFNVLQSYDAVSIDCSASQTLSVAELNDSLLNFDVVVLGEAISSGNAYAKGVFDIVNKVPMLNLKSYMYKSGVWSVGGGSNPSPKATAIKVAVDYAEDPLFDGVTVSEDSLITLFTTEDVTVVNGNLIQGYTTSAGSLFENDEIIAYVDGIKAIHSHGNKNRYMLIPISSDNMNDLSDDAQMLVYNAISVLATTKSAVQKAAKPNIQVASANMSSTVSISCGTPDASIFYSVDGGEYKSYAESFEVTKDSTLVKAYAVAHGYDVSDTASVYVLVMKQLSAPVIDIEQFNGYSVITLNPAKGETANIYYAFADESDKTRASLYKDPIIVEDASTIYAFAEFSAAIQSVTSSKSFEVGGIPVAKDTVAHFLPSKTAWADSCQIYWAGELLGGWDEATAAGVAAIKSSAYYHFGTSAKSNFSTEVDHTDPVLDEEGNPLKTVAGEDSVKVTYKVDPSINGKVVSPLNPGWAILSEGQVVTIENAAPVLSLGSGSRNADAAIDLITGGPQCKGLMDFGSKASGCSYNLRVQTTEKHAAPFYVETYIGNGSTKNECAIQVQVSMDGTEWTAIQDLTLSVNQRFWRRHKVHFNEAGEYYVRIAQVGNTSKGQLYDVMIITTDGVTGIESIAAGSAKSDARIFDLQGRQVSTMIRGQLYIQNGKKVVIK